MATIYDVAQAAGVTIATVSSAFTGKRPVASGTRKRILEAAADLGYRPNAAARMLVTRQTGILALSAPQHPDMFMPAQMNYVSAVTSAARAANYDILLLAQADSTIGISRVLESSLVDGVILLAVQKDDERFRLIEQADTVASAIGLPSVDPGPVSCVDLDYAAAARLSVNLLVSAGRRKIGLIGHSPATFRRDPNFLDRYLGAFVQSCQDLGAGCSFEMVEPTRKGVAEALSAIWGKLETVDALVLHCDQPVQAMVMHHLHGLGIEVPTEISVLSACSSFDTELMPIPLSVIPHPAEALGSLAVSELLRVMEGNYEPSITLLEPEYVDRGSISPRL